MYGLSPQLRPPERAGGHHHQRPVQGRLSEPFPVLYFHAGIRVQDRDPGGGSGGDPRPGGSDLDLLRQCPDGEQDIASAFANSCNVAFAQIAQELGPGTLEKYTEQAGLTGSYSISGLPTAKGSFDFDNITDGQLGWAGVGQYHDQVNPAALMIYMGAIANGGKAAEPYLILQTESALGLPSLPHFTTRTGTLISADTAAALADLMANNVTQTYGASRFPNMDICAKSGTAEVGEGQTPHAWFAGFLRGEETPYAFVVLVENGGGGSSVAGGVAAKVLDVIVNGY